MIKTLLRNQRLGLVLGGFMGLGIVIASQTAFSAATGVVAIGRLPSADILSIPLIVSYWLLLGLRVQCLKSLLKCGPTGFSSFSLTETLGILFLWPER